MTAMAMGRVSGRRLRRTSGVAGVAARLALLGLGVVLLGACQSSRQQATPSFQQPTTPGAFTPSPQLADAFGDGITTVAILAPLTGADAAVGQQLLNAAQMAAVERGGQNFVLIAKDTQGSPAAAAAAAQQAIAERADIIIGPLRSQEVAAVGPIAAQAGITVVGFSSDASVAGPGVLVMGLTPADEVDRIMAYAARQGASVVAALVPQTAYGTVAMNAFQQLAPRHGLAMGAIQSYNPTDADHTAAVQPLQSGGFDTLFVPDGGASLARIMPFVAYYNVDRGRRVLGTAVWDDPRTLGEPATTGGLFANVDPRMRDAFNAKYQGAYGSTPSQVAGLAYNAVAMAAELGRSNNFSTAAIANPNGFNGVFGAYRFGPDYVADHALAVMQVQSGGFAVVDPAPTSFVGF
ncbi:MAG: penicillin-binding protein activator [Alphaproteobacteria bacterium]